MLLHFLFITTFAPKTLTELNVPFIVVAVVTIVWNWKQGRKRKLKLLSIGIAQLNNSSSNQNVILSFGEEKFCKSSYNTLKTDSFNDKWLVRSSVLRETYIKFLIIQDLISQVSILSSV